jgi:hypothetical protein
MVSGGKLEGKRPVGSPRHRWEYNNKMNLRKIKWESMEQIQLAQDSDQCHIVNTVMNPWAP